MTPKLKDLSAIEAMKLMLQYTEPGAVVPVDEDTTAFLVRSLRIAVMAANEFSEKLRDALGDEGLAWRASVMLAVVFADPTFVWRGRKWPVEDHEELMRLIGEELLEKQEVH